MSAQIYADSYSVNVKWERIFWLFFLWKLLTITKLDLKLSFNKRNTTEPGRCHALHIFYFDKTKYYFDKTNYDFVKTNCYFDKTKHYFDKTNYDFVTTNCYFDKTKYYFVKTNCYFDKTNTISLKRIAKMKYNFVKTI